jgi:hypothetical protein
VNDSKAEGTVTPLTADALAALVRQLTPDERLRLAVSYSLVHCLGGRIDVRGSVAGGR